MINNIQLMHNNIFIIIHTNIQYMLKYYYINIFLIYDNNQSFAYSGNPLIAYLMPKSAIISSLPP